MLQYILPSLIGTAVGFPVLYFFRKTEKELVQKFGKSFAYEAVYVSMIFLPNHFSNLSVPESSMNWTGKLLAIFFSCVVYFTAKKQWHLGEFLNFQPDRSFMKRIVWVGFITLASMCILTFAFAKGKALDVERLAYQATMPGIDEEIWRGIIIGLLFPVIKSGRFKIGHPAIWFTTIIFALGHSLFIQKWNFSFVFDSFIISVILGYVLGWIIIKTKSILPSLILHNLINFSTNIIEMLVLR